MTTHNPYKRIAMWTLLAVIGLALIVLFSGGFSVFSILGMGLLMGAVIGIAWEQGKP